MHDRIDIYSVSVVNNDTDMAVNINSIRISRGNQYDQTTVTMLKIRWGAQCVSPYIFSQTMHVLL